MASGHPFTPLGESACCQSCFTTESRWSKPCCVLRSTGERPCALLGCSVRGPSKDVTQPPRESPVCTWEACWETGQNMLCSGTSLWQWRVCWNWLSSSCWFPLSLKHQFLRLTNFWLDLPSRETPPERSYPQAGRSLNSCSPVLPTVGGSSVCIEATGFSL